MYNGTLGALLCNHCCRGKGMNKDMFCSLSYPACKAHAPYYYVSSVACPAIL
jgi:hypothetical protein